MSHPRGITTMLPESGRTGDDLLAELTRLTAADLPVRGGKVTAYVYDTGRPEVNEVAAKAYFQMLEVNGLDPTAGRTRVDRVRDHRMAVVNAVLDALPPRTREALLIRFLAAPYSGAV